MKERKHDGVTERGWGGFTQIFGRLREDFVHRFAQIYTDLPSATACGFGTQITWLWRDRVTDKFGDCVVSEYRISNDE